MVEVPTNLETYSTALNTVLAASDGSVDELNAINHAILTGEGIDQIIESFAEENPEFAQALRDNKDKLKKPDVELSQLTELNIEIPKELAEKLGLAGTNNTNGKTTVNIGEFTQAALKETLKENDNTFGLGNLNSETIDLLCLLLCQDSKSKIIETLKETLKSKVAERANLSNEYQEKTVDMLNEQVEALKAAKAAKRMSIFSAIANAILSVFITAASVAFTVATCGAGAAAIAVAAIAVTASIASTAASVASAGCTIASLATDDPEKKEKLDKATLGLGIASAVFGLIGSGVEIAGSIAFSAAKIGANAAMTAAKAAGTTISKASAKAIGKAAAEAAEGIIKKAGKEVAEEMLEKIVKNTAKGAIREASEEISKEAMESIAEATTKAVTRKLLRGDLVKHLDNISTIITIGSSLIQGATNIASGALNIESAKTQRSLDNIKIEMAKLDQEIETLIAFIDSLTNDVQKFMEDFLKNEQEAVETLHAKSDVELQLAQKPA